MTKTPLRPVVSRYNAISANDMRDMTNVLTEMLNRECELLGNFPRYALESQIRLTQDIITLAAKYHDKALSRLIEEKQREKRNWKKTLQTDTQFRKRVHRMLTK